MQINAVVLPGDGAVTNLKVCEGEGERGFQNTNFDEFFVRQNITVQPGVSPGADEAVEANLFKVRHRSET